MSAFKVICDVPREIAGDLSSDLSTNESVVIAGSVRGAKVTAGALRIDGDVEHGELVIDGEVIVGGTLRGDGKSRCVAGGPIRSDAVVRFSLMSRDNISVGRELDHTRTCASGAVTVGGTIRGGHTAGHAGVECRTAGSSEGVATVITAGVDHYFHAMATRKRRQIELDLAKAQQTKQDCQSTLARVKMLTPKERESLTISLYEAEELEQQANAAFAALREKYESVQRSARAEVTVRERIHAGVSIRLGNWITRVVEPLAGEFQMRVDQHDGHTVVVLSPVDGGPSTMLEADRIDDAISANDALLRRVA